MQPQGGHQWVWCGRTLAQKSCISRAYLTPVPMGIHTWISLLQRLMRSKRKTKLLLKRQWPESNAAELGTSVLLAQQFPTEAWGLRPLLETLQFPPPPPPDGWMGSHSVVVSLHRTSAGSYREHWNKVDKKYISIYDSPSPRYQQIYVKDKCRHALTPTSIDVDLLKMCVCVLNTTSPVKSGHETQ